MPDAIALPCVINFIHGHPAYWCPVCEHPHHLDGRWKWNGDYNKPTFGPSSPGAKSSFLSYYDAPARKYWRLERTDKKKVGEQQFDTEAEANAAKPHDLWVARQVTTPAKRRVFCHVHVTDGMIRILPDTPGPLGGKTVPLQPWSAWKNDEGNTCYCFGARKP